jgi:high-affinity nickel-transport protein
MARAYKRALDRPLERIRYNLVVTGLSVAISVAIVVFQLLSLIREYWAVDDRLWSGIDFLDSHFTALGGAVVAVFMALWLGSIWWPRSLAKAAAK